MAGLNKVLIIGHLGRDPEIKYTQSNVPIATMSIATSEAWKDKTTGEWQEKTEWHRVVAWRGQAERAEQKLKKGSLVYIEGRLETRKWQDKDGSDRYTTEIVCDKLMPLLKDEAQEPAPAKRGPAFAPPPAPAGGDDDDLPF